MCSWALLNNADRRPQRRVVFHDNFVPRLTDSSGQQLPPVSVRLQFLLPSDTMETRKQTSFDASFASRPARRAVIVTRHLLHGRVSSAAAAAAVRVLIDDVEWSEEHECVNHPRFLRGEEEKAEANGSRSISLISFSISAPTLHPVWETTGEREREREREDVVCDTHAADHE